VKVLTVFPDVPAFEGGAAGRCAIGFLEGLRAHSVDYRALAARRAGSVNGAPPLDLNIELVEAERPRTWRHRLDILTRPCGGLSRGSFGSRVRQLATDADILHLDQIDAAWCSADVDVPAVVNIHYLVRQDRPVRGDSLPRLVIRRLGELAAMRRHVFFAANSPLVAGEIRRAAPGASVVVSPLSVDPSHYRRAPLDGEPTVAFIGTGWWPATARALTRLVKDVWPLIARRVPQARLRIAGRGTDQLGLQGPRVDVLGAIPSSSDFLQDASVLLFPLERGSGMKVKVLEALASGVPVVTTPLGAEGFDADDGGVVVDGPRSTVELADAAVRLLNDPDERRERGASAHRLFSSRYTPELAVEPIVDLYERILS
jgi:glycosyltransferase involved in cell wall biosynthesis